MKKGSKLRHSQVTQIQTALQQIAQPSFPIWLALSLGTTVALNDAALASRIDHIHIAAMGFCEPLWLLIALATSGLCSGITVGLAREQHASRKLQFLLDAFLLAVLIGLALIACGETVACILNAHHQWLSGTAPIVASYFAICSLSNLPFTIMQAQCAVFRADGRNRCVLALWSVSSAVEIILSNMFVIEFHWHSLVALATAWLCACMVASVTGAIILKPTLTKIQPQSLIANGWSTHLQNISSMLRIGGPIALSELGIIVSSFLNLQIVSSLPDSHLCEAAWAVKSRIDEAIEIVPISSVGLIIAPFIASNLPKRGRLCKAFKTTATAVITSCLIMLCSSLLIQVAAPYLVAPLCDGNELRTQATKLLALGSLAYPFFAVTQLLFSMLEGTGETCLATIATLCCILPLRLGLATILKDCSIWSGIEAVTAAGIIAQAALAAVMLAFVHRQYRRRFT